MAGMIIKGRDGEGVHTHDTSTDAGKFYIYRNGNGIRSLAPSPSIAGEGGRKGMRTKWLALLRIIVLLQIYADDN